MSYSPIRCTADSTIGAIGLNPPSGGFGMEKGVIQSNKFGNLPEVILNFFRSFSSYLRNFFVERFRSYICAVRPSNSPAFDKCLTEET